MRLLLLLLFASHFFFNAQVGFFGKKNIVEINAKGNVNFFYNSFRLLFSYDDYYKNKGGKLVRSLDLYNYGFSLQSFHYFNPTFGAGLEVGYDFQNIKGPTSSYVYYNGFNGPIYFNNEIFHERLKIGTITIMPKFDFAATSFGLPTGLSNQLGIGITMTSIRKDNYLGQYDLSGPVLTESARKQLDNTFSRLKTKGFSFLYQLNYRVPISKRLLVNWGIRYFLNIATFRLRGDDYVENNLRKSIFFTRLSNVIQFNVGLGFTY